MESLLEKEEEHADDLASLLHSHSDCDPRKCVSARLCAGPDRRRTLAPITPIEPLTREAHVVLGGHNWTDCPVALMRVIDNGDTVAGRYRIERRLGEGGMATVYAAIDSATGNEVALKWLIGKPKASVSALFEREYRALSSLRHPGIVEVFDYGLDQGRAFYTMELLKGQELSRLAPMPWRDACACLRDIASILGILHARGLITVT